VNFLVAWQDFRSDSLGDIHGARVTPGGTAFDGGSVVSQQGNQSRPRLCRGNGGQLFLVYQGWAGSVGGKTYNTQRIWGKMNPSPGIEEGPKPQAASPKPAATIARGVLVLGAVDSRQNTAYRTELLDISGRKVLDLHPGANDVRSLAPGVYFERETQAQAQAQAIRKVVVTR
jgi:hypothetical protein